jgi:heme O synthase-like polyprenyltransferase
MYSELGKIKLGSMVVITTMAGYYMAPYSSFDLKRFVSHVSSILHVGACASTESHLFTVLFLGVMIV